MVGTSNQSVPEMAIELITAHDLTTCRLQDTAVAARIAEAARHAAASIHTPHLSREGHGSRC